MLCECAGQGSLLAADDDAFDPAPCLDCGGPTPIGKWRCANCQTNTDHAGERMRAVLDAARLEESRESHDD